MTQIRVGTEEYAQLLREWGALRRLKRAGRLTTENAARLKVVNGILHDAELATHNERYSEEVHP